MPGARWHAPSPPRRRLIRKKKKAAHVVAGAPLPPHPLASSGGRKPLPHGQWRYHAVHHAVDHAVDHAVHLDIMSMAIRRWARGYGRSLWRYGWGDGASPAELSLPPGTSRPMCRYGARERPETLGAPRAGGRPALSPRRSGGAPPGGLPAGRRPQRPWTAGTLGEGLAAWVWPLGRGFGRSGEGFRSC